MIVTSVLLTRGVRAAETTSTASPPRTIADITAILDQERPDAARIAKMRADADAEPPQHADARALVNFYYVRAAARSDLGRFQEAVADAKIGIDLGVREHLDVSLLRRLLGYQYNWSGDIKHSLEVFLTLAEESNVPGRRGHLFSAYRWISFLLIAMGDLDRAERYLEKNEALLREAQIWPEYADRKATYLAHVEYSRGRLFEARGQFRQAETAYRRAELLFSEILAKGAPAGASAESNEPSALWSTGVVRDNMIASQGIMKARQGRYAEGELDVRRALLSRLASVGKYNLTTATIVLGRFTVILLDQGRYGEAEKLIRTQLEIFETLGVTRDSQYFVTALNHLASLLALQGKWPEAAQAYASLDEATESWRPERKAQLANVDRILALYNTGRVPEGIAAAELLLAREEAHFGPESNSAAYSRAAIAVGLYRAGRDLEALREFRRAVPVFLSNSAGAENDDTVQAPAREQRSKLLVESYMALLASHPDKTAAARESFRLADAIRSHSVQKALTQAGARAVAADAELAGLARREQDTAKQIAAQLGVLNKLLATPKEQRSETTVRNLQLQIERLQAEHRSAREELAQKFPAYVDLTDPKPPSVDEIKEVLKPQEAFLSFYLGSERSFVWVIPPHGPPAFASIDLSADDIAAKVKALRAALEPRATLVSDIPPFDVVLAHELYKQLLEPVEAAWKGANSLIVAANGPLGGLPLSLLPTAPAAVSSQEPLFAGYRDVPWLARTHAVIVVPSAAALRALRRLPAASGAREPMIGFGDPYFSLEQAAEAARGTAKIQLASVATRGLRFERRAAPQIDDADRATLGLLPRLPDTADELQSIALALRTDPATALHLGKDANEAVVKATDLSRYRIVVFATHGLEPGELDGLQQPALALTAPEVADVPGDGLLTMEEILALRLDADWVVLSACNTGSGAGAGAEAASGLGRAFFYAGTRAILVTNWSVHSASARELVADLFRRQAANPAITRGEALRRAMTALLDEGGFSDQSGKMLFSYGHPLFWAPYTIIGDGS